MITGTAKDHRLADVVWTFAERMDLREWSGYRAVFRPEIEIDYSFSHPEQKGRWSADDWVAKVGGS